MKEEKYETEKEILERINKMSLEEYDEFRKMQFIKTQEIQHSQMKISFNDAEISTAFKIVTQIDRNWLNIKDMTDNEPRGITEKVEKKQDKNYFKTIYVYLKNKTTLQFEMNPLTYRWYRFFLKIRLGIGAFTDEQLKEIDERSKKENGN